MHIRNTATQHTNQFFQQGQIDDLKKAPELTLEAANNAAQVKLNAAQIGVLKQAGELTTFGDLLTADIGQLISKLQGQPDALALAAYCAAAKAHCGGMAHA